MDGREEGTGCLEQCPLKGQCDIVRAMAAPALWRQLRVLWAYKHACELAARCVNTVPSQRVQHTHLIRLHIARITPAFASRPELLGLPAPLADKIFRKREPPNALGDAAW